MPEIKAFRNMARNNQEADLGDIELEFSDQSSSKKEGGEREVMYSCEVGTLETMNYDSN